MYTYVESHRRVAGAMAKSQYIANALHPQHLNKEVQVEWIGCEGEFEFALELESVKRGDGRIKRGRKIQIPLYEFLVRTPFKTILSIDEFTLIKRTVIEKMGIVMGRLGQHVQRKDERGELEDCLDIHLMALNRDRFGRPLSARVLGNLYLRFRKVMDQVHDQVNEMRRLNGVPEVPTMKAVRGEIRQAGRASLVAELADSDVPLDVESIIIFLKAKGLLGKRFRSQGGRGGLCQRPLPQNKRRRYHPT